MGLVYQFTYTGAGYWGGTTFRSFLTSRNLKLTFGSFVDTLTIYLSYYLISLKRPAIGEKKGLETFFRDTLHFFL